MTNGTFHVSLQKLSVESDVEFTFSFYGIYMPFSLDLNSTHTGILKPTIDSSLNQLYCSICITFTIFLQENSMNNYNNNNNNVLLVV